MAQKAGSCQDCGLTLEGYGYGGWLGGNLTGTEPCLHAWYTISAGEDECLYCHKARERVREAS
jgi:hypothetical protein